MWSRVCVLHPAPAPRLEVSPDTPPAPPTGSQEDNLWQVDLAVALSLLPPTGGKVQSQLHHDNQRCGGKVRGGSRQASIYIRMNQQP